MARPEFDSGWTLRWRDHGKVHSFSDSNERCTPGIKRLVNESYFLERSRLVRHKSGEQLGPRKGRKLKKEYHETDYHPHVCCSHYVCRDEYYPIYQLHSCFQQATGTHRNHLDPETNPGLLPFSYFVQFSI